MRFPNGFQGQLETGTKRIPAPLSAPPPAPSSTSFVDECESCPRGDHEFCIDGVIYGYCGHEHCGGVCESRGDCDCDCHFPEIPTVEPLSS